MKPLFDPFVEDIVCLKVFISTDTPTCFHVTFVERVKNNCQTIASFSEKKLPFLKTSHSFWTFRKQIKIVFENDRF